MPIVYPIGPIEPLPSRTPSVTPTISITPTISVTPSVTPSEGWIPPSPSLTPTISSTPSITPTISVTPTITVTPTPSIDCGNLNIFDQMQAAALQFMTTNIGYYKLNLNETKKNIYGESLEKWYYQPLIVRCSIERNPETIKDEMFGPDVQKSLKITVPRISFDNTNIGGNFTGVDLLPEIGDMFEDRSTERYYEIHNITTNYIPITTNFTPTQILFCQQVNLVIYELDCYQTRVSRLNILPYKII
jgi:hypothetical protein